MQELATAAVDKPSKLGKRTFVKWVIWVPWVVSIIAGFVVAGGVAQVDPGKCVSCRLCEKACPMSLPVADLLHSGSIDHPECIQCSACCDACRKGALSLEFGRLANSK